jgi:hypothetical protein
MNELWEQPTRDPIDRILRSHPGWIRQSTSVIIRDHVRLDRSGHVALFKVDELAWSSTNVQIENKDDWVWYSDHTPLFFEDLKKEWDVVWLVSVHPNRLDVTLSYLDEMLSYLGGRITIYIGINEDYLSLWNAFLAHYNRAIHPTSFSVGINVPNLVRYEASDILPPLSSLPIYDDTPALCIIVGQISSNMDDAIRYLVEDGWEPTDNIADAEIMLREGRKVFCDNDFASRESRLPWRDLALMSGVQLMVLWCTRVNQWPPHLNDMARDYINNFDDPRQDTDFTVYRWD